MLPRGHLEQLSHVVEPDGSWRWKDEDELETAVRVDFFTPPEAEAIRGEGEAVVAEWPFPTGWEDWRADPTWPLPTLPADWDRTDWPCPGSDPGRGQRRR